MKCADGQTDTTSLHASSLCNKNTHAINERPIEVGYSSEVCAYKKYFITVHDAV